MQIPLEIEESILRNTPVEKLVSLCRSSRDYYSLCSQPSFWKEKFQEENLPLFLEGETPRQWIEIYRQTVSSLNLAQAVTDLVNKEERFNIFTLPVEGYMEPSIFTAGEITENKVKYILLNYQRNRVINTIKDIYSASYRRPYDYLAKELHEAGERPLSLSNKQLYAYAIQREGRIIYTFGSLSSVISLEELEELLTKLFFFVLGFSDLFNAETEGK